MDESACLNITQQITVNMKLDICAISALSQGFRN